MRWATLLDPVRKAVRDLLLRIDGAESARLAKPGPDAPQQRPELGSCFLVYGSRGTGKTTVLLSAQQAVQGTGGGAGFFDPEPDRAADAAAGTAAGAAADGEAAMAPDPQRGSWLQAARASAGRLRDVRHIVWLDPLDLEPLPRKTNLLTALLTRVRDALDAGEGSHDSARERMRSTSIFEETGDDPRQLLEHLINDATLMWEEIQESDTRNKALRQRAAADIYAHFRQRFLRAMDALSRRLALRYGHDEGCSILLPIDNIDRSTEHLRAIVKLAQMVSHPCLWLVMAGDRVEVETFLERAYWTELILSHEGADARGKAGESGEDETLGMARRQGQATAQKVWPPSHRIEVDYVHQSETLSFTPPGIGPGHSLRDLLSAVPVKCFVGRKGLVGEPSALDDFHDFKLIRLFEIQEGRGKDASLKLTRAGNYALRLPARNVLDLWQLVAWMADNPNKRFGAVKIARTMLRSTAAGSTLPNLMGQRLQNEIIRRDPAGGTLLNFGQLQLHVRGQLSAATAVGLIGEPELRQGFAVRSALMARRSKDMRLVLTLEGANGGEKLPELVAAWLAILHDILIYEPRLAVLGMATFDIPLVQAHHDLLLTGEGPPRRHGLGRAWTAPAFVTFQAQDIFWRHWETRLELAEAACRHKGDSASCQALRLALGWLNAALQTFVDTCPSPCDVMAEEAADEAADWNDGLQDSAEGGAEVARAVRLYERYRTETTQALAMRKTFDGGALCAWLENDVPLLLSQVLTPGSAQQDNQKRLQAWLDRHAKTALVRHWRQNGLFLRADVDLHLIGFEPPDPAQGLRATEGACWPADARTALATWARGGLVGLLGASPEPTEPRSAA